MPWNTKSSNQMIKEFIQKATQPDVTMAELCREYNISRKTGYKWVKRYRQEGEAGLRERSRCPLNKANKISEDVLLRIVRIRVAHRYWGADKIRSVLRREHVEPLPGRTTIHRILKEAGLIHLPRRRKTKISNVRLKQEGVGELKANDEWTIDFKGWWRSRDGKRKCYPLTIRDAKSRYILGVTLLENGKEETVRQAMIEVFKKYGLPKSIRSDNGTHERMHRDMKKELQAERADTQSEMDEWVDTFNNKRPHQALNGDTPAMHYHKSSRKMRLRSASGNDINHAAGV